MIDITLCLGTVITMFIVLCVGYFCRKKGIITDDFSKGLSNLIIQIGQPLMIINAIIKVKYSDEKMITALIVMAIGVGVHILAALIGRFATLPLRKTNPDERKITEFAILFANCGFMGLPVLQSLLGDEGAFWGAFYIVIFNIVQWTYGMMILGRDREDIKPNVKKIFINYGTTPCIVGVIIFVSRIQLPVPVVDAMDYIGSICTPISMLIVGGLLAKIPLKKLFTNVKIFYYCGVKLLILPFCVLFAAYLLRLPAEFALFATVMSCLPTASNTVMYGERFGIIPEYAAHSVTLSTFLSALTIPVVLYTAKFILGI